jgi:hypothetical protein
VVLAHNHVTYSFGSPSWMLLEVLSAARELTKQFPV